MLYHGSQCNISLIQSIQGSITKFNQYQFIVNENRTMNQSVNQSRFQRQAQSINNGFGISKKHVAWYSRSQVMKVYVSTHLDVLDSQYFFKPQSKYIPFPLFLAETFYFMHITQYLLLVYHILEKFLPLVLSHTFYLITLLQNNFTEV